MINSNANGGTEQLYRELHKFVPENLLDKFQLWFSRYDESKQDYRKIQILYLHDLPGDPMYEHLKNGGWKKFERLLFVSHWQMQAFQLWLGFPWSKAEVIHNAIEPIPEDIIDKKRDDNEPVRLIYHTTPHRGLELLVNVFEHLYEDFNISLDVYSSFGLYGWQERDKPFEVLFDRCRNHPGIKYYGAVSPEIVRKAVGRAHIFAYPSVWPETGCRTLMEAMSARCLCLHPNYGCLFETAGNWTNMYQWQENRPEHQRVFASHLRALIKLVNSGNSLDFLDRQKEYSDRFYGWENQKLVWVNFLESTLK